jgi:hypothetical protein
MSLVTMADLALPSREPRAARPRRSVVGVAAPDNEGQNAASSVHETLGLIVAYIPSEILVTYVAVVAAIQRDPGAGHTVEWGRVLAVPRAVALSLLDTVCDQAQAWRQPLASPPQALATLADGCRHHRLRRLGVYPAKNSLCVFPLVPASSRNRGTAPGYHAPGAGRTDVSNEPILLRYEVSPELIPLISTRRRLVVAFLEFHRLRPYV